MRDRAVRVGRWAAGCVAAFGQGKSFRDNPVIGNRTLNRLGLHVGRVIVADAMAHLRWGQLAWMLAREQREAFHRDGFLVVESFLPPDLHARIVAEVSAYRGPAREMVQGDTATTRVLLDGEARSRFPACAELLSDRRYQRALRYASSRHHAPLLYVQQIRNGATRGRPDPQKNLHSDTFHPTMKAWYFLDDVAEDAGAFTYVPGSHRSTLARLRWEYAQSLVAGSGKDRYAAKGSLRIREEELPALGLPPPRRFAVRANTLVIANTHGFHARGPSLAPSTRREIWAYARGNPFVPFAFTSVPFLDRIEQAALRLWWKREDARARRAGTRPAWRLEERSFGSAGAGARASEQTS